MLGLISYLFETVDIGDIVRFSVATILLAGLKFWERWLLAFALVDYGVCGSDKGVCLRKIVLLLLFFTVVC